MIVRAASLPVLPEPAIFVEVIDRPRIRITVVEVPDFLRHTMAMSIRVLLGSSKQINHELIDSWTDTYCGHGFGPADT